jgi:hypothetical protein
MASCIPLQCSRRPDPPVGDGGMGPSSSHTRRLHTCRTPGPTTGNALLLLVPVGERVGRKRGQLCSIRLMRLNSPHPRPWSKKGAEAVVVADGGVVTGGEGGLRRIGRPGWGVERFGGGRRPRFPWIRDPGPISLVVVGRTSRLAIADSRFQIPKPRTLWMAPVHARISPGLTSLTRLSR